MVRVQVADLVLVHVALLVQIATRSIPAAVPMLGGSFPKQLSAVGVVGVLLNAVEGLAVL